MKMYEQTSVSTTKRTPFNHNKSGKKLEEIISGEKAGDLNSSVVVLVSRTKISSKKFHPMTCVKTMKRTNPGAEETPPILIPEKTPLLVFIHEDNTHNQPAFDLVFNI